MRTAIRGYRIRLQPGEPPVILLMDGRREVARCRFAEVLPVVGERLVRDGETGFVELVFGVAEYERVVDLLRHEKRVWIVDEVGGLTSEEG